MPPRPPTPKDAEATDSDLVRAAQAGDAQAFEHLYILYARTVHSIVLAHLRVDDVDDCLQEVFLAAFRQIIKLREPSAFGAWLASIARNRANEVHRTARRAEALSDANEPEERAHQHEQVEAADVLQAIRSLPAAYRETLVLRLVEGFSGLEIAAKTGLTPASVRVNLHRGMDLLRQALGEEKRS
jgi:RNA polymerase sigma-70 factor (ECF subfamily)